MPRTARFVWPGAPHHVTQRGNRRGRVFFSDADRMAYLAWLQLYATRHGLEVLAYCLMSNHVHLVVVPTRADSMQLTLRSLHTRYAQRVNRLHDWKGHLWQGRYFAAPLDENHFWSAMRYVERNPVRAGMVTRAEDYAWSSAPAHCTQRRDDILSTNAYWCGQLAGFGNWSRWLTQADDARFVEALRNQTLQGLPCGSNSFVTSLESSSGRRLRARPAGRPPRERGESGCVPD